MKITVTDDAVKNLSKGQLSWLFAQALTLTEGGT